MAWIMYFSRPIPHSIPRVVRCTYAKQYAAWMPWTFRKRTAKKSTTRMRAVCSASGSLCYVDIPGAARQASEAARLLYPLRQFSFVDSPFDPVHGDAAQHLGVEVS